MPTSQKPSRLSEFNEQLLWFALKGVCDEDDIAAYRTPGQLRTIFGSNTDCTTIAAGIAAKLVPPTLALTPFIQRGFCKGRQLGLNVVDFDSYMRAYNVMHTGMWSTDNIANLPVTALYDFCNAFPTMLHQWLFLVLDSLQLPATFKWVIWWLYSCITAYSSGAGDGSMLFSVDGGVKTGCPASSIRFLLGTIQ